MVSRICAVAIASVLIMQIGSFGITTNPFTITPTEAMHGTPILVKQVLSSPGTFSLSMYAADILTDDSSGNGYMIYPFPSGTGGSIELAKITPAGTLSTFVLVGLASTSPLLAVVSGVGGSQVVRIHNDVIYVFMIVTLPDTSTKTLASKCSNLANIGLASCWTKFDGTSGVDLLPWELDFGFGMDIDSSGIVYISSWKEGDKVRVRTFTPGGVGWSVWQLVGTATGFCFVAVPTNCIRYTDIEVDDDTGIVHIVANNSENLSIGLTHTTLYSRGATPGAIPSGFTRVTTVSHVHFFGAVSIATFPGDKVLVLHGNGIYVWNFFDGTNWVFGTVPPSMTAGQSSPFGFSGATENIVWGVLSKAPDGKGRAFTMTVEGGPECSPLSVCNKYQLRTFDPATNSWSSPTTVYTTPPPVHATIRSHIATRVDGNPNSCNQWYAWYDPHLGKLFADFEGPGNCRPPDLFDVEKFYTETDVNWNPNIDNDGDGLINEDPVNGLNDDGDALVDEDDVDEIKFGTNLPTDSGKFLLQAVVKKDGTVSNYNPGQYYAVTKVTIREDLSNLWIEELFGDCTDRNSGINLSIVNPNKVPGGAAVVIVDPLGAVIDRSDELAASGALFFTDDDNDLITDNAELHLQESIPKDSMIYLYVKFAPGLKEQPLPSEPDNMCNNEEIVSTMIDTRTVEETAEADLIVKAKQ